MQRTPRLGSEDMYEEYWGLNASPFQKYANDIHWFYPSPSHDEVLARLYFLVEQGRRFGLLIGPSGSGKTLLLNVFADEVKRSQRDVAIIDLIGLNSYDMLWHLAASLKLEPAEREPRWTLWRNVEDHLQAMQMARVPTLIAFDHLERADSDCIPVLQRLLHMEKQTPRSTTFIATARFDQELPFADSLLEVSDLRVELTPFSWEETDSYITDLLEKAGSKRQLFDQTAIESIFEHTEGVARDINRLCDMSLLAAMAEGRQSINADLVDTAAAELQTDAGPSDRIVPLQELH